ncbi:MAG TPA: hypothetical protein VN153_12830, partial [Tahibacter sp.]|nr:hypothetical protein [Tahibacter sp.]
MAPTAVDGRHGCPDRSWRSANLERRPPPAQRRKDLYFIFAGNRLIRNGYFRQASDVAEGAGVAAQADAGRAC